MNCCNHACRQGRDCPRRKEARAPWVGAVLVLILVAACAVAVSFGAPIHLPFTAPTQGPK